MRRSGLTICDVDSSTLGELRAAIESLADLPDETFVTMTGAVEIKIGQQGSRFTAINAYAGRTDEQPFGKPNREARRARR